ncbi:MAG: hypothetical protein LBB11_03425, partial [Puniceicoccales bacterium]|nr:hypothetical protein [Puniceicoccales bacterium]
MNIKMISDDEWSGLYYKPLIFIGFHTYGTKIVTLAADNEGVCACYVIENTHAARQKAFMEVRK